MCTEVLGDKAGVLSCLRLQRLHLSTCYVLVWHWLVWHWFSLLLWLVFTIGPYPQQDHIPWQTVPLLSPCFLFVSLSLCLSRSCSPSSLSALPFSASPHLIFSPFVFYTDHARPGLPTTWPVALSSSGLVLATLPLPQHSQAWWPHKDMQAFSGQALILMSALSAQVWTILIRKVLENIIFSST